MPTAQSAIDALIAVRDQVAGGEDGRNNLVNAKINELNSFIASAPNSFMNKVYHVDPNGNDNNSGSSESRFQTIDKALSSTPVGGKVTVKLYAGTHLFKQNGFYQNLSIDFIEQENGVILSSLAHVNDNGQHHTNPPYFLNCNIIVRGGELLNPIQSGQAVHPDVYRRCLIALNGGSFGFEYAGGGKSKAVVLNDGASIFTVDRGVSVLKYSNAEFKGVGRDFYVRSSAKVIKTVDNLISDATFNFEITGVIS